MRARCVRSKVRVRVFQSIGAGCSPRFGGGTSERKVGFFAGIGVFPQARQAGCAPSHRLEAVPRLTEKDPAFAPIVARAAKLICTTPEFDDLAREILGSACASHVAAGGTGEGGGGEECLGEGAQTNNGHPTLTATKLLTRRVNFVQDSRPL